ncbi:MAG: branched-chain amino acid ABC transporter permease [Acidiferrobacterales bacterium]
MRGVSSLFTSLLPGIASAAAVTVYLILLLKVESQTGIAALLVVGVIVVLIAARFGTMTRIGRSFGERETTFNVLIILAALVLTGFFYEDHFALLLIATVIIYVVAALGLNIQFGYVGMLNFAGAAFFGVGCYTSAVLTVNTPVPHLLILVIGGIMAAIIGSLLILPVLRTRGHYSAVITIAFGLLFKIFLEVNDVLGGPQGLRVNGMNVLGWEFNNNIEIGEDFEASFYISYIVVGLVLLALTFALVKRLERSWIGLNLDAIRLDETAAKCFGLNLIRWKITAFTLGNFLAGMAGALYAMMVGFIAPTNFTFADSLILVSIVLLGGIGNPWGLVVATAILVIVPEKLQAIQEYRFLLFGAMVILMLLFRPEGLLPRPLRTYFPGWQPR